jgi:hypothetical protein
MSDIIEIECPDCHTILWIDPEKKNIIKHKKKAPKKTASFDDLLNKEKEKKEKADERFLLAKKVEEAKKKKAEALFSKQLKDKKD